MTGTGNGNGSGTGTGTGADSSTGKKSAESTAGGRTGVLPRTGTEMLGLLLVAAALVGAGAVTIAARRARG
ncbi:MAG: LPXTG cell wall anchor domain-containing protein [Dermabacter sp.]|nr:LPXTG cell wall anchor domain-containing protein [Dermabacter sp.]